ncbi:MAG: L-histidine N(alpha)-methyltransferase [Candidatus Omnitrophica bacterium]|nr:L-histidine N(alpha)-methyltransferase [Candidatus Omnitrophota bacterium]MCF7892450.1 L-histidine N(alpha)-methyltransferase [Candidatus Omnitrophota bacterium]MCF7895449.1 L-histidine N(alpha)-methyltransferase [Candidatus Omnitrophota bacterium]MCF7897829.1 L-histidine N(alpha)-methyltransferase [Candidatus Omnitrophota bacterium]MCF7909733.1 L-histidine N(alpha)-methyltransferase [Candidatus Omnitrophota bacterium]
MNIDKKTYRLKPQVKIENLLPEIDQKKDCQRIIDGLLKNKKSIPSVYFYDETGSQLFEEITRLPEYYLNRTEKLLLAEVSTQIADGIKDIDIVEIGSGDCSKISILFDSIPAINRKTIRYLPIDISQSAIQKSANNLIDCFPEIEVHGIAANFLDQIRLPYQRKKRLFCFFGSTIGNLSRKKSLNFLINLKENMEPGDRLLLGLDLIKNPKIIEAAYNDSQKVTEKFNQNILNVVNQKIKSDFYPKDFNHLAYYNQDYCRIEMHLKAKKDLMVSSPYLENNIWIKKNETIHTENSHKFSPGQINYLTKKSGFEIKRKFFDPKQWYSIVELTKR